MAANYQRKSKQQLSIPITNSVRARCGIEGCKCKIIKKRNGSISKSDGSIFKSSMYLLIAPIESDSEKKEVSNKTKFFLWGVNNRGLLKPINKLEINSFHINDSGMARGTLDNHVFYSLQKYAVYIIVHFDINFAIKCGDLINKGTINPYESFGEPQILSLQKKGARHEFKIEGHDKGYITANETAHKFLKEESLAVGHKNYGYQVLYENMPNANCQWVKDQIFKLQIHLGHMRYPIGGVFHPYFPYERGKSESGIFSKRIYNCVLAFSRDAKQGAGIKFENHHEIFQDVFTVDNNETFDFISGKSPTCIKLKQDIKPQKMFGEENLDHKTLDSGFTNTFTQIKKGDTPNPNNNITIDKKNKRKPFVFIDYEIGHSIIEWIFKGYRKAGHILISIGDSKASTKHKFWLRDDFAITYKQWNKAVQDLGYSKGLAPGWSYRDIEYSLQRKRSGAVAKSSHKTGLAIDLAVRHYTESADKDIKYQLEEIEGLRPKFRLFAKISEDNIRNDIKNDNINIISSLKKRLKKQSDKNLPFYPEAISQWKYDSRSKSGGNSRNLIGNNTYLDLSLTAAAHGIGRISVLRKWVQHVNHKSNFSKLTKSLNDHKAILTRNSKPYEALVKFINSNESKKRKKVTKKLTIDKIARSTARCYICGQTIKKNEAIMASSKKWINSHIACYQHENKKMKMHENNMQLHSFSALAPSAANLEINLSTVTANSIDMLIEWGKAISRLKKKRSTKPTPDALLSINELRIINGSALSSNSILSETNYLVTYQSKNNEYITKIISGKNIYTEMMLVTSRNFSTSNLRKLWKCKISPLLDMAADKSQPITLDFCGAITLKAMGKASNMEWWHYQYDDVLYKNGRRIPWHRLMEEIGWTKEGLRYIGYRV